MLRSFKCIEISLSDISIHLKLLRIQSIGKCVKYIHSRKCLQPNLRGPKLWYNSYFIITMDVQNVWNLKGVPKKLECDF